MRNLLAFACLALFASAVVRADLVVTASGPGAPVRAGVDATIKLFFLNTGSAPASVDPPAELVAQAAVSGTPASLSLKRIGATAASVLAPGQFVSSEYAVTLPATATGPIALNLQLPGGGQSAVIIQTTPPDAPATVPAKPGTPAEAKSPTPAVAMGPGDQVLENKPAVPTGESGLGESIAARFSPHEPIYFIGGADRPNIKFQVSFKYQIFNPQGPLALDFPPLSGLHIAYSQTSLWDVADESAPFKDSSYRPELLWSFKDIRFEHSFVSRLGLEAGLQHESNGKAGEDSRSMNFAYIRPSITFGDTDGWFLTFAPRLHVYLGSLSDNPDIKDYRGYGELKLIAGRRDGFEAAIIGRIGDDWDKGSLQVDLSYPLRNILGGNVDLYLHAQYFNGFGESLIDYRESTSQFRLGISLVR